MASAAGVEAIPDSVRIEGLRGPSSVSSSDNAWESETCLEEAVLSADAVVSLVSCRRDPGNGRDLSC